VKIRFGYELTYWMPSATYMILMLHSQPGSGQRLLRPDILTVEPPVPLRFYVDGLETRDSIGTTRGPLRLRADALIEDSGEPEREVWSAQEHPLRELPDEVLVYLLSSRYCDTEILMADAWRLFGQAPRGWGRVQAICDFVQSACDVWVSARPNHSDSLGDFTERRGVCRDFAHLASHCADA